MESSGNPHTDLVDDFGFRFIELNAQTRALQEGMRLLEEGEVGELYGNIFKVVYVQIGFFLTFSSCVVALYMKDFSPYWFLPLLLMYSCALLLE